MAVSVTTAAWNAGILVQASGTIAEVNAEITAGAASKYPLRSREYLMGYGGTGAGTCVACWYYKL